MKTFTIADSFDATGRHRVDMSAPLPLSYASAIERAIQLRNQGKHMTWATIATVMGDYHGWRRYPGWWANQLRGKVEPRPRGMARYGRNAVGPARRETLFAGGLGGAALRDYLTKP